MKTHSPPHQISLLLFLTFFTLALHGIVIYSVHGQAILSSSPKKSWIENQHGQMAQKETPQKEEKELQRRNEELFVVFEDIIPASSLPSYDDAAEQLQPSQESYEKPPTVDSAALSTPAMKKAPVTIDIPLPSSEDLSDLDIEKAVTFSEPTHLLIDNAKDTTFAETLIKATTQTHGEVFVEKASDATLDDKGIKVGAEGDTNITGTALFQQEGFIEEGEHYAQKVTPALPSSLSFEVEALDAYDGEDAAFAKDVEAFFSEASTLPQGKVTTSSPDKEAEKRQIASITPQDLEEITGKEPEAGFSLAKSEDFDTTVEYIPNENGAGYLFKLIISPRQDVTFKRIRQNISFLIDRSHSISSERYKASQKAVVRALSYLHPDDNFNILVFDHNIVHFAEAPVPCNNDNIKAASDFLLEQPHGGFFASTDIYASLGDIIPKAVADTEINTAILLSDGDTYLHKNRQRKMIGDWTKNNAGSVALYCIASGEGNNLSLLRLISFFNKGALHYTPTHSGLDKALLNLLNTTRIPIGKDISITAIPSDEDAVITLLPCKDMLPNLYKDQSYVIYGTTSSLSPFHLFIQGRYYDKWLDIREELTFSTPEPRRDTIEKPLHALNSYNNFYRYLVNDDEGNMMAIQKQFNALIQQ
jgi:hypothetical protein